MLKYVTGRRRSGRCGAARPLALAAALIVSFLGALTAAGESFAAVALPAGFVDEPVAEVSAPTALAFTPDGRLLVASQTGELRVVVSGGTLLTTPAIDLSSRLCTNWERGLVGVAVDPAFAFNQAIYLFYTLNKSGSCPTDPATATSPAVPVHRVSRFTLALDSTVDPASEVVLIDNVPSPIGQHTGGDLNFGKDGYLYVTVGDGGCDYAGGGCAGNNDAARDRNVLLGKVLRITRDGGIPVDNPYQGSGSARCNVAGRTDPGRDCRETFAWGLRNPFRFGFDPNAADTRFRVNDVGQNTWEEVNEGKRGADYGWNVREGLCARDSTTDCGSPPAGMTNPIYAYNHATGCRAVTGAAFVPEGAWSAGYDGAYFYGDYVCGKIFRLMGSEASGFSAEEFATGLGVGSAVHLTMGPRGDGRQALYYASFAGTGEVRRIAFTDTANRPPMARLEATPRAGPVPLEVSFDGTDSSDPDGEKALTYTWDFGDGSPIATTSTPTATHTYETSGDFTATLRVSDPSGADSAPATAKIAAGTTPPVPQIEAPTASQRFAVGESIALRGSATDAEDGPLPESALSWRVIIHHDEHTHPFLPPTPGNGVSFDAPGPEDIFATETSYLEIFLTATDSRGATTTVSQDFRPKLVPVTFETNPPGLRVLVNGSSFDTPVTLTSWESYALDVEAPPQSGYAFKSWSDGGAAAHEIITPSSAATYTASFGSSASLYRDAVIGTAGLRFYYRLGERSGTTAVDVKGSRDGTYVGPALGQAGALAGDLDTAVGFDGVDDYVEAGDFAPSTDLSLEAWIRPQDTAPDKDRIIVDKSNAEFDLRIDTSGHLMFVTGSSVEAASDDSFNFHTAVTANRFYHVVVSFDAAGDTVRFYRDGVLTKTVEGFTAAIQNTSFPLRIGRHSQFNFGSFNGRLDEVAIYDVALSGATVQEHFAAGS